MKERTSHWLLAAIVGWVLLTCGWSAAVTRDRFYDEKFGIRNAEVLLESGSLEPENAWYARLSYLPQAGILAAYRTVHKLVGAGSAEIFRSNGALSSTGYFLVRMFSVLCGAGAAILTFLIGRRLFRPEVAILGTALLVSCPWLLRHFVTFKADALNVLLTVLAFWWALDAVESRSWRKWALAGVGVGLCAASKYTGALIALPLVVGALFVRDLWSVRLRRLLLAGVSSIAVFAALHLDFLIYWHFFSKSLRLYSTAEQNSFGAMLAKQIGVLLHWSFYGPLVGTFVLAATVALCIYLVRIWGDEVRFRSLLMFLSFPLGYSLIYALVTSIPKGNNYLVLLPFTSLAAAWLLHAVWSWIAARLPGTARRLVFWPAVLGLLWLVAWPANAYIYTEFAPYTTLERAGAFIKAASFLRQRVAVLESEVGSLAVRFKRRTQGEFVWIREVPALTSEPYSSLDKVDYEIFGEDRLEGPNKDFYLRRVNRLSSRRVVRLHPEWFRTTGPSLILLVHPWYPGAAALPVEWTGERSAAGRFSGRLPEVPAPSGLISLDLNLPRGSDQIESFTIAGTSVDLIESGWDQTTRHFMSERFHLPRPRLKVRLEFTEEWSHSEPPRLDVWVWRKNRLAGTSNAGQALQVAEPGEPGQPEQVEPADLDPPESQ